MSICSRIFNCCIKKSNKVINNKPQISKTELLEQHILQIKDEHIRDEKLYKLYIMQIRKLIKTPGHVTNYTEQIHKLDKKLRNVERAILYRKAFTGMFY